MTKCIGSPAEEMAEQYLAGSLPESEAERFEEHYFGCDLCHEHLLALNEIREGLAREPIAIAAPSPARGSVESILPRQRLSGRILAFPVPVAVLASLAAALLVGAVLIGIQRSSIFRGSRDGANQTSAESVQPQAPAALPQGSSGDSSAPATGSPKSTAAAQTNPPGPLNAPGTELAQLADMHLPGYQAPQLRGEEPAEADHAQFSTGMEAYSRGDCSSAVDSLARVAAGTADDVAAKLYSGLCQFKSRDLDNAEAALGAVVATGDTPELETAEYFLAQARLLRGDAVGAQSWLTRTIALHGDYEERAQKQEAQLSH
jgi:anti-sigma factor RsiW